MTKSSLQPRGAAGPLAGDRLKVPLGREVEERSVAGHEAIPESSRGRGEHAVRGVAQAVSGEE